MTVIAYRQEVITRENFIESMKAGQYKSTPIHIELLDNQYIQFFRY